MVPSMSNSRNSSPEEEALHQHQVQQQLQQQQAIPSDGRIPVQSRQRVQYESTADGDVILPGSGSTTPPTPSTSDPLMSSSAWQARSPAEDITVQDFEQRNPSSPAKKEEKRHSRNLSAHFFDATSLKDPQQPVLETEVTSRKHQRMFSGDYHNPVAHRRINSVGQSQPVLEHTPPPQDQPPQQHRHHREDSAGLDILSTAADASKEDLAAVAASPATSDTIAPWDPPGRSSLGHVSTESSYDYPPASMAPPHRRRISAGAVYPTQQQHAYGVIPPAYGSYPPPPPPQYYPPYAPTRGGPPPSSYPVQYSQAPPQAAEVKKPDVYSSIETDERLFQQHHAASRPSAPLQTQGSQTFVTGLAVDGGTKTLTARQRNDGDVPSTVGHHRKLSSFSSLGTIMGGSLFDDKGGAHPHHRSTSSVSFLQGLDVGLESTDALFLRNLQASNSSMATAAAAPPPPPPTSSNMQVGKLAPGGTSKRVRRKCTVENCPNRVVQGGLCISHGAKRKTCKHPGCNKNVKKAGLCSTHGPARKRCEAQGCQKVAVQGGRCIAHGAKKKMCSVENCTKQAILSGMCKKHHDQSHGIVSKNSSGDEEQQQVLCQEIAKPKGHTRGLSIFQELSADAVSSMLNDSSEAPKRGGGEPPNNPW